MDDSAAELEASGLGAKVKVSPNTSINPSLLSFKSFSVKKKGTKFPVINLKQNPVGVNQTNNIDVSAVRLSRVTDEDTDFMDTADVNSYVAICIQEEDLLSEKKWTIKSAKDSHLLPIEFKTLNLDEKETVRQKMLERISLSSAHFIHQQRGTPDLSLQEKFDFASGMLNRNAVTFLARFGKFLKIQDLQYFQDADKSSYELDFYLKEIYDRCLHSDQIVKNRRFSAMQELEKGGDYFSEEEMKHRAPLLYEQMIGQYLTPEEEQQMVEQAIDHTDLKLSTILLQHIVDCQDKDMCTMQQQEEELQIEEEEDEELGKDDEDIPNISDERANDIRKQQLRAEFKAILQEKFLSGGDADFDYSTVDDNPDYDSITDQGQDAEDKFFDGENPQTISLSESDSDADDQFWKQAKSNKERTEIEDYMTYEPSEDVIAQSLQYISKSFVGESQGEMKSSQPHNGDFK